MTLLNHIGVFLLTMLVGLVFTIVFIWSFQLMVLARKKFKRYIESLKIMMILFLVVFLFIETFYWTLKIFF